MKKKYIIYQIENTFSDGARLHLAELFPHLDPWDSEENAQERLQIFMENDSDYESYMKFTILPVYSLT